MTTPETTIRTISSFLRLWVVAIAVITVISGSAEAQVRKAGAKPIAKKVARPQANEPKREATEKIVNISPARSDSSPVAVVNSPQPDFLSGEANVTVNPKQPTVIRLGLAQNAVSIVEFPASDGIYYIHEGNPKLASVFQSPTKETDRSITIYPGEGFVPSKDGATAAAISLQMRSGLVLILELVPVNELKGNAHRCVITYDRDAVVSARKVAGLAFNLGGESVSASPINSRAVSKLVGSAQSAETGPSDSDTSKPEYNSLLNTVYTEIPNTKRTASKRAMTEAEISKSSNKRLADVLRDPKKHLAAWTPPLHGLQLSVSKTTDLDAENRLVVVAVRNSTASNLRLLNGSPELQVQTLDKDGNSLLTSKVDIRYLETTALEGLVLPGYTSFYALVYRFPTLGINQKVRVVVAHKDAADAPVSATLNGSK
ncbi:MAG: hypothetical protein PSX80_04435 [bacterium]|nr:hypothetical protein [bacterium]